MLQIAYCAPLSTFVSPRKRGRRGFRDAINSAAGHANHCSVCSESIATIKADEVRAKLETSPALWIPGINPDTLPWVTDHAYRAKVAFLLGHIRRIKTGSDSKPPKRKNKAPLTKRIHYYH